MKPQTKLGRCKMPLLTVNSTIEFSIDAKADFVRSITAVVCETLSANAPDVRIFFNHFSSFDFATAGELFSENGEHIFFLEIKLLDGRTREQLQDCVAKACACIIKHFAISESQIRILLSEMPRSKYAKGATLVG